MGNAKDGLSASIGYGKDNDSQNSITRSGINTQNIQEAAFGTFFGF